MSIADQNRSIAKLIVGAMSIDGELNSQERQKVASTLDQIGMGELIADVGAALEEDDHDFNMFKECKSLVDSLGVEADSVAPLIFRVVADVVASDRFVSTQEAAYLSAMAKRLHVADKIATSIFRQVMAERGGRLEISAKDVDEDIHPHLKKLLSFEGAEEMVGELDEDSLEALVHNATEAMAEGVSICRDELARAMAVLGLDTSHKLDDATAVWKDTINNLNLPKMAELGETFVSAAINRITRINNAYKTVQDFHSQAIDSRDD